MSEDTSAPSPATPPILKLEARGEQFVIPRLQGSLFVCSPANGSCCCGHAGEGRLPFENRWYEQEWESRHLAGRVHLTFVGCLGPCVVGNNALLQILGSSLWFKDLNRPELIPAVFDYIEAILRAGHVVPPTPAVREHVYQGYI